MPCFFALSGFLYRRPESFSQYAKNIKKKAIGFLIPYIIFSIVYVVLQHMTTVNKLNEWSSLLYIYKQPISYLWFLYALFFIFVFLGLIELLKVSNIWKIIIYAILFLVSQIIHLPLFIELSFAWIPCFYTGMIFKRYPKLLSKKLTFYSSLLITFTGIITRYYMGGNNWFRNNNMILTTAIFKISSIVLFFYIFSFITSHNKGDYFIKYGKYSMIIYMVHLPITSMFKVVLIRLHIPNYFLFLIIVIALSWFLSIFICYLSKKFKFIDFVFYPNKYIK